ncbi:hypothetical protein M514_01490 [Trichuris suis]|uniref:Uncharacterized protein n=1 Tax=Trichuris suis TaxID=68888 RepID=A0A085NIA0_9BILA|nr:hypothetical protein M513_01490 [Trichuris suis]KFD69196.1 hypothetical protein M514_01490 [Trichuris suis]
MQFTVLLASNTKASCIDSKTNCTSCIKQDKKTAYPVTS